MFTVITDPRCTIIFVPIILSSNSIKDENQTRILTADCF